MQTLVLSLLACTVSPIGSGSSSTLSTDTGSQPDVVDHPDDEEHISDDANREVEDLIQQLDEDEDWPDAGGIVTHRLPYADGVHMGISQGTNCGGHASLRGSIDFTVAGNVESSLGLYAVASAPGTVVHVTRNVPGYQKGTYGNYVLLRHADGSYTLYAHLAYGHVDVEEGDEVCQGHPLGLIGSTGESSGEHLHYEQRDGTTIRANPSFEELDPVPEGCNPCTTSSADSGCYDSINAYDADTCWTGEGSGPQGEMDCQVDGDWLDIVGDVWADDPIDKWSITIGGSGALESGWPDATHAPVDVSLDVSSYAGQGSQTAALWVKVDGQATKVDVCTFSVDAGPNLAIDSLTVSTTSPQAGDAITVSANLVNLGGSASGGSQVAVYLSSTSSLNGSAELLDRWNVASVPGSGSTGLSRTVDIPSDAEGGMYILMAADDGDDVDESDESDNVASRSITVGGVHVNTAVDDTDTSAWCSGSSRDIFKASSISLSGATTDPYVTATFVKCDGTVMSANKSCHVRVGSYSGSYSQSLARASFTWSQGTSSKTVTFPAWTSASSFQSASPGDYKELFLVCSEPSGQWNHWRTENGILITVD